MANICGFEMQITGKQKNVEEFVSILSGAHPERRFARLYDAHESFRDFTEGEGYVRTYGNCAWSVSTAMCNSVHTCDNWIITNLEEESYRLNLSIEIFSEECGVGFQEHKVYVNGECIESESVDYFEYCTSDFDTVEELNAEYGTNFTQEEFEQKEYLYEGGMDWDFSDWE